MAYSGVPLSEWNGSAATDRLHATIQELNATATEQTKEMIRLTRWLVALTLLLAVGLIVQIVLALT